MKILLIEDDQDLAQTLKSALVPSYVIDVAHSGQCGEEQASVNDYDVIILDLVLPDTDGVNVCSSLRKAHVTTPILILTGKLGVEDLVCALDAGADDYLTKPFKMVELLARLRALVRRGQERPDQPILVVEDLVLDVTTKTVVRSGKTIALRRKEFLLLEYLMRYPGKVLTRSMILDHVWESESDPITNTIDVHINCLRDKVDKPFVKPLIKTVHGLGYKIES
jgi:DNA-binding response OmpR family regulator